MGQIAEIFVIDQNREKPPVNIDSRITLRVKRFPSDPVQLELLGHDHPASLQQAIHSIRFSGERIIIMDSDCLPVNDQWSSKLSEVTMPLLAADPAKWGLTHPCYMILEVSSLRYVNFSEGVSTVGIDTGRLVGHQLSSAGIQLKLDHGRPAPWGRGYFYHGGAVYHHGSASLVQLKGDFPSFSQRCANRFYYFAITRGVIGQPKYPRFRRALELCERGIATLRNFT